MMRKSKCETLRFRGIADAMSDDRKRRQRFQLIFGAIACGITFASWVPGPSWGANDPKDLSSQNARDGSVFESTGQADYRIEIPIPRGTAGSEPDLVLRYESNFSDGPFGVGWRVELGEIRRTARYGTPAYDATDQFEVDGVLLVQHPDQPGEYRTFQESFARITRTVDGDDDSWLVEYPDGRKARFGTNQQTRIRLGGSVDFEADRGAIGRWLLAELEDVNGNVTKFSYNRTEDIGTAYPEAVTYTYRDGAETPLGGAVMRRTVQFVLEDRTDELGREQVIFGYPLGIETRVGRRVSEIQSFVGDQIYRRMVLRYASSDGYDTGRVRLWKVQLFGSDCPATSSPSGCRGLPARTFTYTNSAAIGAGVGAQWNPSTEWRQTDPGASLHFTSGENEAQGRDRGVRIGDINGDGYPDYVQAWKKAKNATSPGDPLWEAQHEVYLNDGSGWGTLDNGWKAQLTALTVGVNVVKEVRRGADNDETCSARNYYSSDYNTFVFFRSENPFNSEQRAIYNLISPNVEARLIDLNADGFSDIVISFEIGAGSSTADSRCGVGNWDAPLTVKRVFINNGIADPNSGGGWTDETADWVASLPVFYSIYLRSDGGTGSQLPGIAWTPGKWRGNLERPKDPSKGITYAYFFDHGVRMPDLNGDGRPDIVASREPVTFGSGIPVKSFPNGVWLSEPGGTGWAYADSYQLPVSLVAEFNFYSGYPKYVHDADAGARFADVNGDGLADLVKTAVESGSGHGRLSPALLTKGVWLNTGSGWCDPYSGNRECTAAQKYLPPTNFTTISSVFQPPSQLLWSGGNLPLVRSSELSFVDLNGDGLVDLVKTDHPRLTGMNAWIHDPSRPGIWRQDDRYIPDAVMSTTGRYVSNDKVFIFDDGVRIFDFNGDATVDFMRDRLQTPSVPRAIHLSKSAQMDLLRTAANGRGGVQEFGYTSAIKQRHATLEMLAEQDADALDETGSIGLPRWTARPIVSSLETRDSLAGGEIQRTTMTYAMPRWDPLKRSLLGFRAVEARHSDASETDVFQITRTFFWQRHGRAGRSSRIETYDGQGAKLRERTLKWDALPGSAAEGSIEGVNIGRLVGESIANHYADGAGATQETSYSYANEADSYGYNFVHEIRTIRPSGTLTVRRTPDRTDRGDRWIKGLIETEVHEDAESELLQRTDYAYDQRGLPVRVARTINQRYVAQTPSFATTAFLFDAFGNLIRSTDPENRSTYFCYDGDTTFADGSGCPDEMAFGTHTVVVGVKDPLGDETSFSGNALDLASGSLTAIDRLYSGDSDWIEVDSFNRPTRRWSQPANQGEKTILATREYVDDPNAPDNPAHRPYIVDRRYFDRHGAVDDAATVRTANYFDGLGRRMISVAPRAPNAVFPYGKAITARDYAGRPTRGTFESPCVDADCTNLAAATYPEVAEITQIYDALGRVLTRRTPDGVIAFGYRRALFTPPAVFGAATAGPLDAILTKDANGVLTEHLLDGERVVMANECDGVAPDRTDLLDVACLNPKSTFYVYEASGEVAAIYDATNDYASPANRLVYRYDTLGRVYLIEDPDGGTTFTRYDAVGNVKQTLNVSVGATTNVFYEYDELNRLKIRDTPNQAGDWDLYLEYDPRTRKRARLSSSGSYSEVWEYDDFGNLKTHRRGLNGQVLRTDFQFDLLGRLSALQSPLMSTEGMSYAFDGAYLSRICGKPSISDCEAVPSRYHIRDVAYDAIGRPAKIAKAPGDLYLNYYTLNDAEAGRAVQRVKQVKLEDDGRKLNLAYHYNDGGQVTRVEDARATVGALGATAVYEYDQRGRLMSWTAEYLNNDSKYFAYDELGNLRGRNLEDANSSWNQLYFDGEARTPGEGGPHAIATNYRGEAYRYDGRGNVTQRGDDTFITYNSLGQIYCVGETANTCTTFFWYDVDGHLLSKTTGTRREIYLGDYFRFDQGSNVAWTYTQAFGKRIVAERKAGASLRYAWVGSGGLHPIDRYLLTQSAAGAALIGFFALLASFGALTGIGERPVLASLALVLSAITVAPPQVWAARNAGGKGGKRSDSTTYTRYLFHDHLGSEILALDDRGMTVERRVFEPFGEVIASQIDGVASVAASFTGKSYHGGADLYYFGARWYDAAAGRFASIDPILQSLPDPQTHNPYSYVRNEPIGNIDPDGREYGGSAGGGIGSALSFLASALHSLTSDNGDRASSPPRTPNGPPGSLETIVMGDAGDSSGELDENGARSTAKRYGARTLPQNGVLAEDGVAVPQRGVEVPRLPDFYNLSVNVALPIPGLPPGLVGWTFSFNLDRELNGYFGNGPNIGKALTGISGSATGNWLNQRPEPTEQELESLLAGHGFNVSGGWYLGGGVTWSPGNGAATSLGVYSPQIGAGYTYSWQIWGSE